MTVVVALNTTQRASLVLSHQGLTERNHLRINCKINTRTNILQNNSCNRLTTSYFSVSVACYAHFLTAFTACVSFKTGWEPVRIKYFFINSSKILDGGRSKNQTVLRRGYLFARRACRVNQLERWDWNSEEAITQTWSKWRHKNSLIFRQHFGCFACRQSPILKLKHFDARIFGSLRLKRIHTLTFSRFWTRNLLSARWKKFESKRAKQECIPGAKKCYSTFSTFPPI